MNFPVTRSLQRYEFLVEAGYVENKRVLDMGCGPGHGSAILCINAATVVGIDLLDRHNGAGGLVLAPGTAQLEKLKLLNGDFFVLDEPFDVVVSIEVFEHMPDLDRYLRKAASLAPYFFVTTPLAPLTGKTDNLEHVAEYSRQDFRGVLGQYFDILDEYYQRSDLTITNVPCPPNGSSMKPDHVVQMAWCRSRERV